MSIKLSTEAELLAEKAENLPAFSGLKLLHVKNELTKILALIGRDGIFDEYTLHDISHIDEMLSILQWLVPEETKKIMTPADWLMIVLGIYFHDIGMLVSKKEFEQRHLSGFSAFCENDLFSDQNGKDYKERIQCLDAERRERFLYQEFVRSTHARRSEAWVAGRAPVSLGVTHETMAEVDGLLDKLDRQFRKDLGMICMSHHEPEITDLDKYRVNRSYGNSQNEMVNLQFAAILLRVSDLLHMTRQRTPSIMFKLVSPADPLSQEEWSKQMAVRRVCGKIGNNRDGIPDPDAQRDTIEIHAFFEKPEGFFALTSYIRYIKEELRRCYDWIEDTQKKKGISYSFPWRFVDETNIEAEGFLTNTFGFTLDQERILELLTGHTLYNDTSVVVRELAQNSIDAIRLQRLKDKKLGNSLTEGVIQISWNEKNKTLRVSDNGTGMSQRTIERHLLNVGSSLYQDGDFQRQFPEFASISRFGIGVLSAFMIADEIEFITCDPDDDKARHLTLRSVHGRYLIRLLDKASTEVSDAVGEHGTSILLRLRPTATLDDITDIARHWVVIPGDGVSIKVCSNELDCTSIGYDSLRKALESQLEQHYDYHIVSSPDDPSIRNDSVCLIEFVKEEVTLAIALQWSSYLREWSFLNVPENSHHYRKVAKRNIDLGICVQGVRVTEETPGFLEKGIFALANITGTNAPKTNVARTGFEKSDQHDRALRAIYELYVSHIKQEIDRLHKIQGFSLSWAITEATYLIQPIFRLNADSTHLKLLKDVTANLPIHLVERGGLREAITGLELGQIDSIWTIECSLFFWADALVREIPASSSITQLLRALSVAPESIPAGTIVCTKFFDHYVENLTFDDREINMCSIDRDMRRIDLKWDKKQGISKWWSARDLYKKDDYDDNEIYYEGRHNRGSQLLVPQVDIPFNGILGEVAIKCRGMLILAPNHNITQLLRECYNDYCAGHKSLQVVQATCELIEHCIRSGPEDVQKMLSDDLLYMESGISTRLAYSGLSREKFLELVGSNQWGVFDPLAWDRREQ